MRELIDVVAWGDKAAVVFVVQRPDATRFSANLEADPVFAEVLNQAGHAGVSVRAFGCDVSLTEITLGKEMETGFRAG